MTTTTVAPANAAVPAAADGNTVPPVLRLRLVRRPRVSWSQDTHDNEHDGKQSSKSCCIFHKKRAFDESSTESDASDRDHDHDSSDDDSSSGGGPKRRDQSERIRAKLKELELMEALIEKEDGEGNTK